MVGRCAEAGAQLELSGADGETRLAGSGGREVGSACVGQLAFGGKLVRSEGEGSVKVEGGGGGAAGREGGG